MSRINKVIKYEDLPLEAKRALLIKYPDGWKDFVRKITKPNGEFFYAINVDTETVSYLIKVNVKVDSKSDVEKMEESLNDSSHGKDDDSSDDDNEVEDVADEE